MEQALERTIQTLIDSGGDPWEYNSKDIETIVQWIQEQQNKINKKDLIKNIAEELKDCEQPYDEINAIETENEYEDVAERIINKFLIHNFSQQSELLIGLVKFINDHQDYLKGKGYDNLVEEYLNHINHS